ncbi:MAG: FG-GAP-like repeat-containing protein, partial [Actinobacteria bacterium]|nr:FG-GAP-like repeat-containing protein [Actinomycetota bacterium]
ATVAPFSALTGAANPLNSFDVGNRSTAAFADLDSDGDIDAVAGEQGGAFLYFRNTGSAINAAFVAVTGAANPMDGQSVAGDARPALADLDGDGDLDLIAGASDGTFSYFRNTGTATAPAFTAITGASNPLNGQDVGDASTPAFGDLDGDGDFDLLAGELGGAFFYFRNTGTASAPTFTSITGSSNPLDGKDVGSNSNPALGDLDGDGDLDLVGGDSTGAFAVFENTVSATSPVFVALTAGTNPLAGQSVSLRSAPALGDFDSDGDLDLASGRDDGGFAAFRHLGSRLIPQIVAETPLTGLSVGVLSVPALGDLDGDGDLDLVSGERFGQFLYFRNTGSAINAAFVAVTGASNPLDGKDVGDYSAPALGDLDGDGDLDLVSGERDGQFFYFRNTGNATTPAFVAVTGAANPFNGLVVGSFSSPSLGDLDGDGELDLVSGRENGAFHYFRNTGNATTPAYIEQTGPANPLASFDAGVYSTVALGDFDGDGDVDLVATNDSAIFAYFDNTGTRIAAAFTELTGSANPLDGEDVGSGAAPSAGDLDGNGHLDLVTGDTNGKFYAHYLPEPARGVLLAAGIALLSLFERLRSRNRR